MPRSIYSGKKIVPLAGTIWEQADRAWNRRHFDTAERLFKQAASMGHDDSMNSLARLFEELGRRDQAMLWYKRAVKAGNGMAAWNIAMTHALSGQRRWYRHWIKKAAAMGYDEAIAEAKKIAKNPGYMIRLPLEGFE